MRCPRVCLFFCVCLTAVCSSAEEWGEPVTLKDDPNASMPNMGALYEPPTIDATGRLWAIRMDSSTNHYLCTYEDQRWQTAVLNAMQPGNRGEVELYVGPNGNVVYRWTAQAGQASVITELRALRCRHSSPASMPNGELRIYEDALGVGWFVAGALSAGFSMSLPRPEELRLVYSTTLKQGVLLHSSTEKRPMRAISDSRGHYWLTIPHLATNEGQPAEGIVVIDTVGDLDKSALQQARPGRSPWAVNLIGKDGQLCRESSFPRYSQQMDDLWLGKKDDRSLWLADMNGISEVDMVTFKLTPWWTQNQGQPMAIRPGKLRCIDIQKVGSRWMLATDLGAFWLEQGKLTMLVDGAAEVAPAPGGLWLHGQDAATGLTLAFLPQDGGAPRWVDWPQGFSLPEFGKMCGIADGALCFYSPLGMSVLNREAQQRLMTQAPQAPEAQRFRLFPLVLGPIFAPSGNAYLYQGGQTPVIHRFDGQVWSLWRPDPVPARLRDQTWAVADDKGRVWILSYPDDKEEQEYLVYDPATGQVQTGPSLKAALDDPVLCPGCFCGAAGEYRVPVLGKDGFAAVVTERTMQCRVKGAWLPQVHYIRSFAEEAPLNGACYLDDAGRFCAEAGGKVFALTPGEMVFKPAPELAARYPQMPPTGMVPPGGLVLAVPAGRETPPPQEVQCSDALGITWRIKENALLKEAHGLSATVVPASQAAPFRDWKRLSRVIPDRLGGVFLRADLNMRSNTAHVGNAFRSLETTVTATPEPAGMVKLVFGDAPGLSHAWRVEQEPWRHTAEKEVLAGPYPPGERVVDVYAFDAELNVDPTPESIPVSIAGSDSPEGVIDALLHGNAEQQKWGVDALMKDREKGVATVRQALESSADEHARWVLEAVLQQLSKAPETPQTK